MTKYSLNQVWRVIFSLLIVTATLNSVGAYELEMVCQDAGGWTRDEGQCDTKGLLQGEGKAHLGIVNFGNQVYFSGKFVDGLPDGRHRLTQGLRRGPTLLTCDVSFVKGQLSNEIFTCVTNNKNNKGLLSLTPEVGKVKWEINGSKPRYSWKATMDLPRVHLEDELDFLYRSNANHAFSGPGVNMQAKLDGQANQVSIFTNSNSGLVIMAEALRGKLSYDDMDVEGLLTLRCEYTDRCKLAPAVLSYKGGPVDTKYIITINNRSAAGGKPGKYQMVFLDPHTGDFGSTKLLYYRDPAGLEFDGSNAKYCSNGIGEATLLTPEGKLDIRPRCGKITSPDGRSFEGEFDGQGRPRRSAQ